MAGARYKRGGMYAADMAVYARIMSEAETNDKEINELKIKLTMALRQEVSPKQRLALRLYYVDGMKMKEIAEELGVDRSTVSRTLKRAENNLRRCLRFGAAALLDTAGIKTPYGVVAQQAKREGYENC